MEDQPNVFLAPKPAQPGFSPRLGEIRNAFPLPGKYHFRFKSPLIPGSDRDKDCIPVWMDCIDDNQHVSVWRGGIFAKVTRISLDPSSLDAYSTGGEENPARFTHGVDMPSHSSSSSTTSSSSSVANIGLNQPSPSLSSGIPVATETLLDVFDTGSSSSSTTSSSVPPSMTTTNNDPLSLFGGPMTATPVDLINNIGGGGVSSEGSLLDMDAPVYASNIPPNNNYASTVHADFMGMTIAPSSSSNNIHTAKPTIPISSTNLPMNATISASTTNPSTSGSIPPSLPSKMPPNRSGSSFSNTSFSNKGPFGDLGWK